MDFTDYNREEEEDTRAFTIALVIEHLESLKSYDMFCGYGGDFDVDKCDLNKGDYIKREDLEELIGQMKTNAL